MTQPITVIKNDHNGKEVWSYDGEVIERGESRIILEAFFNREDRDDGYITWRRGDRFVEYFYNDRWYNIFEVHDVESDTIKGWYCNITRPAHFTDTTIASDDLALDLFVYPDGRTLVQDEAEYTDLPIPSEDRARAEEALRVLQLMVTQRQPPFDAL
jgi:protein associated with RNAse G/E